MSFFIDVIIIAVFVIAMIIGWKKGFVSAIMRIVSTVGAIVITWLLYNPVADFLYNKIILGGVTNYIGGVFDHDVASTGKSLTDLFAELPEFFTSFIERFSTRESATAYFAENAQATASDLNGFMAKPIAQTISKVIAIILLFIVLFIVLKLLTMLLKRVVKLPLLNGVNHVLGLILGAVAGLAVAWLLAVAFHAAIPSLASLYPKTFSETTFSDTLITSKLYDINPIKLFELFKF